jgi:flagellar motor switch protein FliM
VTPAPFDFRQPPPGELERQVSGWLALAGRRAAAAWPRLLPFPAELAPGPVKVVTAAAAADDLSADAVGYPLTTGDPADGTAVLAMSRRLMLALLAGLLGDTPPNLPDDREPSELERSLTGFLVESLFLEPLHGGWPGPSPLAWTARPPVPARTARRVPPGEMTVSATLTVKAAFAELPVYLLLPRSGRWEELGHAAAPPPAVAADPDRIAALVREMPVDLTVILGTTELTMSDVAGLRAGDLLVLRRKVGEPLDGLVGGSRRFRVWPGAVGTKAAVQIHAPAED